MSLYKQLVIREIIPETPDTKTFVLEPRTEEDVIAYKPGQFLTLVFQGTSGEQRRSFSLSSIPLSGAPLCITVKRIDNGAYSRLLHDKALVGDTLVSIGSSGFFILPDSLAPFGQLCFFAAGSGITPIFSLLKSLLLSGQTRPIMLVYSNRDPEHTIFYDDLKALQQKYAHLKVVFLFSTAQDLSRARLSKSLVASLLGENMVALPEQTLCYICGPFDYMRMVSIALLAYGFPAANIRKEDFLPLKLIPKELPPDTNKHIVTLRIEGGLHQLVVQYPDTILSAAKAAGVSLPYSCEAGRCGTCVARCESGRVWMSYNEVLVEQELAKGLILTCTGYPVGGDVLLQI